ncbi:MAG: alginate export family protein [Pseudomonadota bacterium]
MTNGLTRSLLALLLSTGMGIAQADEAINDSTLLSDPSDDTDTAEEAITPAPGEETLVLQHKLTLQGGYGPENSALGEDRTGFYSLRYEPSLTWYSPDRQFPTWQAFARAWLNYSSAQITSPFQDPNEQQPQYFSAELREFYLRRNLLGGDPRYSLSLGRQKFSDHYGLWWDDTLESLRLDYADTFSSGFVAVAQKFDTYNSDIDRLQESEQDIAYAMGEYARRWSANNWVGTRLLFEQDGSDEDANDPSDWRGGRLGLFAYGDNLRVSPLFSDYRLELAALKGRRDQTDAAGFTRDEDVEGWVVIGDIGKRFDHSPWMPRLSLRAGLTDKPSTPNEGFFLNNIQSDRVANQETYTNGLLSSFIGVDLHNLAFYSLAVETRPRPRHSFDVRLSDLYLRDAEGGIPINLANGVTTTGSKSLGQILDTNYYWQMFPVGVYGRQLNISLLLNAGYFRSGNAIEGLTEDFQVSLGAVMRY